MNYSRSMQSFKVVLVGCEASGKTTLLRRLLTRGLTRKHCPTLGVEVSRLIVDTDVGAGAKTYELQVWDCAGSDKYCGLREGYGIGADGVIALTACDCADPGVTPARAAEMQRVSSRTLPQVDICNKADLLVSVPGSGYHLSALESPVSAFYPPFQDLLRGMTGKSDLVVRGLGAYRII